jgi:hypothetical protein
VVALASVAGLLAQDGLWAKNPSGSHPDALTTLALVLAILAFLTQLFVYVFQSEESRRAVERADELNVKTQSALDKIETNSSATQQVLFSQFDRLLDFVVGAPQVSDKGEPLSGVPIGPIDDSAIAATAQSPLTAADVRRAVMEALQPLERPRFTNPVRPEPSVNGCRSSQGIENSGLAGILYSCLGELP